MLRFTGRPSWPDEDRFRQGQRECERRKKYGERGRVIGKRSFPNVMDLSVPENLMAWAKTEGRRLQAALDKFFQQASRFSKRGPLVAWDRSTVNSWPPELLDKIDDLAGAHDRRYALWFSRPFLARLCDCWDSGGPGGYSVVCG